MSESPAWHRGEARKDRPIILVGFVVNGTFREPICEHVSWVNGDWQRIANGSTLKQCDSDVIKIDHWIESPDNLIDGKPNACDKKAYAKTSP